MVHSLHPQHPQHPQPQAMVVGAGELSGWVWSGKATAPKPDEGVQPKPPVRRCGLSTELSFELWLELSVDLWAASRGR